MRNETPPRGLTVEPALGMAALRLDVFCGQQKSVPARRCLAVENVGTAFRSKRRCLSGRRKLQAHCADRSGEDFSIYFQQFIADPFTSL
jgi:hypothetical protein